MSDVWVVSPHPDDEVIGCGGGLLNHSRAGRSIAAVTLGARLQSTVEGDLSGADYQAEQEAAHRILGISRHSALGLPGRPVEITQELLLFLVGELRRESPRFVYVPHRNESDWDHRQTHHAALEALWMAQSAYFGDCGPSMSPPEMVVAYEVWTPLREFQYAENIDDVIEAKIEAMRCYKSQLRRSQWDEAIRGLAKYRGVITRGQGWSEVYEVVHLAR